MPRVLPLLCIALASLAGGAEPAASPKTVRLNVVGDIMLDTLPGEEVKAGRDPFRHVAEVLKDADFTIGNLECVVAVGGPTFDKKYNWRAHPRVLPILKKHFHAFSLANNHAGDFGDEGLMEMIGHLDRANIWHFGGGKNLAEARRPRIIEKHGVKIAFLGYNEFQPEEFEAGPNDPGIAWAHDDQVLADIKLARTKYEADIVIPYLHWGVEMELQPDERQKTFARKMIDAGADVVIGGHPHVLQGHDLYKGKLIVYSLGNFVFDDFDDNEGRIGWILRLNVGRQGLVSWDAVTTKMDEKGIPSVIKKTR